MLFLFILLCVICLLHIDQRATESESLLDKDVGKRENRAQHSSASYFSEHCTYSFIHTVHMETCTNQPAWSRDKTSSKKKKNKYSKSLLHQVMGCHKWTSTEINQCTFKKIKQMICEIVCCWMQLSRRSWIYSTGTVEMTSHQCTLNPLISLIMECDMNIWNRIYNSVSLPEYLITNVQHHFKSQISNNSN